ncbi:MAG TPA: 4-(cytidine 5'-diphospho)-2-C-methyl-D-erythritol kinase [Xanthobacteraceae bacterium]|nr:4-(cytidine 5'-diphospho)-2-C-methyl-D-erythritol kinase [Xanthobacteraceae bacterium]
MASPVSLTEDAPAKVNLTLRVLGRRGDGYHDIESLVVFADFGDRLTFAPGGELALTIRGPSAAQAGASADNLVLKAAHALAARIPDIALGAFELEKNLPVAAGIGGGSADAAAALRLIARANDLSREDPRLYAAARATGADVPVCLDPRPRLMHGIGEKLSAPLVLPPLHAVLVNPGVSLATKDVFAGWTVAAKPTVALDLAALTKPVGYVRILRLLTTQPNDLEGAAIALAPVIADVLAALRELAGCGLARMSGSGATCFGLFASAAGANAAAKILLGRYSHWWIRATTLG